MKNSILFLALLSFFNLSCDKDDLTTPVTISEIQINGLPAPDSVIRISAGQYLEIRAIVSDPSAPHTYSWSLTPDYYEIADPSDTNIVWRPTLPQEYQLNLTVQSGNSSPDMKNYTFKVEKADFRYELWGNHLLNVMLNENVSHSELISSESGLVNFQVTENIVPNGHTTDKVEIGDYIGYRFNNEKLSGAIVTMERNYGTNGKAYVQEYNRIRGRLSEYNFISEENIWGTSFIAQTYKNLPEMWDEAFIYGYVKFREKYKSETSNIIFSMERDGAKANISIEYIPL